MEVCVYVYERWVYMVVCACVSARLNSPGGPGTNLRRSCRCSALYLQLNTEPPLSSPSPRV